MSCFPVQIDVEILTSDDIGEASLMSDVSIGEASLATVTSDVNEDDIGEASLMSDVSIGEAGLMSGINMDEVPII